ncbi:MAG TPA: Pycsar system effector family protein [Gammaproteobacteria bacterium]|nr:Pycsar system effector family protein [Gammaproteobacteria bacterium]
MSTELASAADANEQPAKVDKPDKPGKSDKEKKEKRSERRRGLETLFRVTYRNHISLSQLADQKAGMLISINGLIISVLIAFVAPRAGAWSWTLAPALVLVAGCVSSLAFAVIAARPRVDRTPVTVEEVRNNQANLLFFGHFLSMPLADFQAAIRALGKDRKLLHDSLTRQLYSMGEALTAKYRCLQLAYTLFLIGVATAAVLFAALFVASAASA